MSQYPDHWTFTTLGRVVKPRPTRVMPTPLDDRPYLSMEHVESDTTKVVALGRAGDMKSACMEFAQGDVLYGRLRPYLNKVCRPSFDGLASAEFITFRDFNGLDPRFLMYLLSQPGFVSFATQVNEGDRPRVKWNQIREFEFGLPPLDEQQRIAEAIEEQFSRLDAGVESLQRAKRNLSRLRAGILKAAVQGRLVGQAPATGGVSAAVRELVQGSGRPRPDKSSLGALPEGWVWLWLPELGELGRGKSRHRPRNDPALYGGPYPFVQTGDVRNSGGRIACHSQTYSERGLAQSRLWPADTVCITIAANIAESALLTYPVCFPDSVVGLIADREIALPDYVELFIRTARSHLDAYAPATAQKNINLQILSDLAVPIPPIEEQVRIIGEVSRYQSIIEMAESATVAGSRRSAALRRAILREAFVGCLVPREKVA